MLVFADMSRLLKCVVIAVVLLAGIVVLSVCAEGFCSVCSHDYIDGTNPSRSMVRVASGLRGVFASALSLARWSPSLTTGRLARLDCFSISVLTPLAQSPLRI